MQTGLITAPFPFMNQSLKFPVTSWNNDCCRRRFLQSAAMTAGGLALVGCSTMNSNTNHGFVDAHVHVWTPDLARYPLASGFKREDMRPASFTPEELLALARPNGVSRIVLIQMSYYRFDNSYMLDTMRRFPGVFSGVGIVDDSTARPQDKMRELARQGVRGFRIGAGKQPITAGMEAMWKCAGDDGLAICPLINPDALPVIDGLCERFPQTRVVLDHFARVGVSGEFRDAEVEALCRLARHKHTHVKVSAFYALGKKQPPYLDLAPLIRRVRDAYGADRLMWATDCPFQLQKEHTYAGSVELIRDRLEFLSAQDKQWLLGKTAEKLFFA